MNRPAPTMTLNVDLTNPGQFLACCGLLELASRVDANAVGWFDGGQFLLCGGGADLLQQFIRCPVNPLGAETAEAEQQETEDGKKENDDKSPPVLFDAPFHFVLDWWTNKSATDAGFKTWAGGQSVAGFINGMFGHLSQILSAADGALFRAVPIRKPKPFYFDARLARLTSLDFGFSAEDFAAAFSPAVEVLAFIGLQRFGPRMIVHRECYGFSVWEHALPVTIAAAVAHGLMPALEYARFCFPLVVRTGGKYKAFGPALPERIPYVRNA